VDIYAIAHAVGITDIREVDPDDLNGDHALLHGSVLFIDKNRSMGQKFFSIAHEVGHIVLGHIDITQVSEKGVADISREKKRTLFQKAFGETGEVINRDKLIEYATEESADYFAASLLMPMNRFLLWEDKSNSEIANAFKVEERSIIKRREEVEHALMLLDN
jgi:Zn-dependent peptidase ImmA (M78 family)